MKIGFVSRSCRTVLFTVLGLALMASILQANALGQSMFISTVGDNTGTLALYKSEGKEFKQFALIEIKGSIEFGTAGILKGEEAFLRIQTIDAPEKWLKITKRELIKGRVVITTEDKKVYTIYDLQGNYVGKIMHGSVEPKANPNKEAK